MNCLKSLNPYKLGQNNIGKWIVFVCMFEILKALINYSLRILLCNKNFASVIRYLLSFSAHTFRFEVFFTKNPTSQVSVEGF